MEEFSNYENGKIDINELIRQLRGYSDGVELRIDTMKRDLPESDARNELETIDMQTKKKTPSATATGQACW